MDERKTYEEKLQAKLDEWNEDIAKLQAKADEAREQAQDEIRERVEDLKKRREELEEELQKLRKSNLDAWSDLKAGCDRAWHAMGEAMRNAFNRHD
ncbi:sll1863 family stress response protein [Roseovarius salinarum]|uniref:hypothetical protein n=1 Tax=Roseovarius salinarum TaxID=1981892 RepID=UPI000C3464BB|nr:hypothetical protein [Roseovarius salinarum]